MRERLPERVAAALERGRVQVELRVGGPELRVGGGVELEEDLGVDAHVEGGDGGLFPARERRREGHGGEAREGVLQDAEGEGADGVRGADAGVVRGVDGDVGGGGGDVGDDGVEEEARVVGLEEGAGFAAEEGVEAALVEDVVVGL